MFGNDYAGDMIRERYVTKARRIFVTVWVLGVLGFCGFWGGVIWAAVHFIKKYW